MKFHAVNLYCNTLNVCRMQIGLKGSFVSLGFQ